jgi:ABC-2 type transport system ATP-binding protein
MDEAELCQRVGFLSQGKLIALDTPDALKKSQMHGHVLEINTSDADRTMQVLKQAQSDGRIPFDEVALYGAQIHAVVPNAEEFKAPVWSLLIAEGIDVHAIEWIAPTLEDVFISAVKPR